MQPSPRMAGPLTSFAYASSSFARSAEEGTTGALGADGVWNSLTCPTWALADWMWAVLENRVRQDSRLARRQVCAGECLPGKGKEKSSKGEGPARDGDGFDREWGVGGRRRWVVDDALTSRGVDQ